jgi:hypothetical protein
MLRQCMADGATDADAIFKTGLCYTQMERQKVDTIRLWHSQWRAPRRNS